MGRPLLVCLGGTNPYPPISRLVVVGIFVLAVIVIVIVSSSR